MERQPASYILANDRNGTLYIGVTSDLVRRTWQHREHLIDGFAAKYNVAKLVWYELHPRWKLRSRGRSASKNGTTTEDPTDRGTQSLLE